MIRLHRKHRVRTKNLMIQLLINNDYPLKGGQPYMVDPLNLNQSTLDGHDHISIMQFKSFTLVVTLILIIKHKLGCDDNASIGDFICLLQGNAMSSNKQYCQNSLLHFVKLATFFPKVVCNEKITLLFLDDFVTKNCNTFYYTFFLIF